jgi:hypothetical protein
MGGDEKIFKKPVNAGSPFYVWQQIQAQLGGARIELEPNTPKTMNKAILILSAFAFAVSSTNASIVLYSSSFAGSSGTDLDSTGVITSGATGAQHTQYGTSASATWSAATNFKADGSFDYTGAVPGTTTQSLSGSLVFTPQNGYVYSLTMTTDVDFTPPKSVGWFAAGFLEASGYTGAITTSTGGGIVWMLTRPGDQTVGAVDQQAHFNVNAGTGARVMSAEDTSAPSSITIVLDTTGGTGAWSAQYYVGDTLAASVPSLGNVNINSVGIAANIRNNDNTGRFQSFALSVVPEPSSALLGGLGMLFMLRRRR